MKSRAAGPLIFIVNLAVFLVCASLAFARNINALFYHYDGSYMMVDASQQLRFGQPLFAYTNNFLQSVGNIQFLQNARLLFFYWPVGWFSDFQVAKIASCLVGAWIMFTSAYAVARLLSQSRAAALISGWILGFAAGPFVPLWFFYPALYITPQFLTLVFVPVIAFWLIDRSGRRTNLLDDAVHVVGLLALVFYGLAAAALLLPVIILGTVPYLALALCMARSRSELVHKFAVLAAALLIATILRWPWLVLGIFLDSAPHFFPEDFTSVYFDKAYASLLFKGEYLGWAGPLFVAAAASGALLSLRSTQSRFRAAAWMTVLLIALFASLGFVLVRVPLWVLPPPIYFEIVVWPLYATFAAAAALAVFKWASALLGRAKLSCRIDPRWIALPAVFVIAAIVILSRRPTPIQYPFPQRVTPVVAILKANVALEAASAFRGRIMTAMPVKPGGGDAWGQQFSAAADWALAAGNDEMSVGLWSYRIPTLFEYNQFLSPEFHALAKRTLQRPPLAHQRNIVVLDYPDARILQLLGVRYVLMPQPPAALGAVRATEDRGGVPWGLVELAKPNLATYSPTEIETRSDLGGALDFVEDADVDLSKRAIVREELPGPFVAVRSSALSIAGRDLRVAAESDGRSIVIVPVEFSHCLALAGVHDGASAEPRIVRIDSVLAGIVFEHHLDAVLSFRIGPLDNPRCRWLDYQDVKAMLHRGVGQ